MKDEQKKMENNSAPQNQNSGSWKRLLGKKWFFPGMYLAAAALILSLMWVFQDTENSTKAPELGIKVNDPAEPVAANNQEVYSAPFDSTNTAIKMMMNFYDDNASVEQRQAAMVFYAGSYRTHNGVDYVMDGNKTFDVLAVKSGKVSRVLKDPLVGNMVEIQHADGITSIYESLSDVAVAEGDEVIQGEKIAQAGANLFEKEHGVHLHFELMKEQAAVNPEQYLPAAPAAAKPVPQAAEPKAADKSTETPADKSSDKSSDTSDDQSSDDTKAPATEQPSTESKDQSKDHDSHGTESNTNDGKPTSNEKKHY